MTRPLTIYLSPHLAKRLKAYARKCEVPQTAVVRFALDQWLDANGANRVTPSLPRRKA